jgi:hypothetical protein
MHTLAFISQSGRHFSLSGIAIYALVLALDTQDLVTILEALKGVYM